MAEELQRHLIEYKQAKEVAATLRLREEAGLQTHSRSGLLAGIEAQLSWTPPTLTGLEVQSLSRAFQRLLELQAREEAQEAEMLPVARVRVSERIATIIDCLRANASLALTTLLANEHSRLVIVVTFLAILELWKWQRIDVRQHDLLGPIFLERGERWDDTGEDEIEDAS